MNVDQSKLRTYDYITGRWWQVDPLADQDDLVSGTPYNYSFNNPGDLPIVPLLPLIAKGVAAGITMAAESATVVAGTVALAALWKASAESGADAPGYSPAVGFAMSSSSPGELTSGKFFKSESKPKGSNNEKTNESAKTGQEAHRQEQKKLKEQGAETEVNVSLKMVRLFVKML